MNSNSDSSLDGSIRIFWIRHGEIVPVEHLNRFLHPTDIGLSESGKKAARDLAFRLKPQPGTLLYASGIRRAFETASLLKKNNNSFGELVEDARLEEYFPRELYGRSIDEAKKSYGLDFFDSFLKDPLNFQKFSESESVIDAAKRIKGFFENVLAQKQSPNEIWIVSHGTLHNIWLISLLGKQLSDAFNIYRLEYLAMTRVTYNKNTKKYKLVSVNEKI